MNRWESAVGSVWTHFILPTQLAQGQQRKEITKENSGYRWTKAKRVSPCRSENI